MTNSIDQKIMQCQHAIENALNYTGIQKKLNTVAFDRKKLLEGKALNEKLKLLQTAKNDSYGSQASSTDAMKANLAEAQQVYLRHIELARIAFRDDRGMQMKLDMIGTRKKGKEAWLSQAMTFYGKAEEIASVMAGYGVSLESLQQTRAMVEALISTRQQQLQKKGEAQDATEKRDDAIKAMNAWMRDFNAAARLALRDNPQWLEMLGIMVRNTVK